jgi:hypothetical protein
VNSKEKNLQELRACFRNGGPRMFTFLPLGGTTFDGKQKWPPSIIKDV